MNSTPQPKPSRFSPARPHRHRAATPSLKRNYIEAALRRSLELLVEIRGSQCRLVRDCACQTTADKSTQVSQDYRPTPSSEIRALKDSIKAISKRLRELHPTLQAIASSGRR